MSIFARFALFLAAGSLSLIGCSESSDNAADSGADSQPNAEPGGVEETEQAAPPATEEVLAGGLQAVFESVDGAEQCGGGDIAVRSYEDWDRTGDQWFGDADAGSAADAASGPRPTLHAYTRFCTPRTDEHAVTYLVEVQGFGSAAEASSWLEALHSASAEGSPLADWRDYTGQPSPEDAGCEATAISSSESEVSGAAFEVTVDSACRDTGSPPGFQQSEEGHVQVGEGLETNVEGVEADPPDYAYDHEPDSYTLGAAGSWTYAVMVREQSEQVAFTYEGFSVDSWSKNRVQFDQHEAVVTALTEALEEGRTGTFLDEAPDEPETDEPEGDEPAGDS